MISEYPIGMFQERDLAVASFFLVLPSFFFGRLVANALVFLVLFCLLRQEEKKKFEKQTAKFVQSQERHLNLSTRKQDAVLQEAAAILEMEQRHFCQASLEYVFRLQEVHERKKFEFVETVSRRASSLCFLPPIVHRFSVSSPSFA